jgi:predicted molibdopterin-dependent oxidoreductase YjgC
MKYFNGRVDFRLDKEVELYEQRQDDLLRRLDKHANTRGAMDLGLASNLGGLQGLIERAYRKEIRGLWISFHPQLVGSDKPRIFEDLRNLVSALEFSVVSTTHVLDWARQATVVVPMAAWGEEKGTYTNYAGRIQITARAVLPPGDAQPLETIMTQMLVLSGTRVPMGTAATFEWLAREVPAYSGLDYNSIGPLGAALAYPQEVLR